MCIRDRGFLAQGRLPGAWQAPWLVGPHSPASSLPALGACPPFPPWRVGWLAGAAGGLRGHLRPRRRGLS
eukprot:9092725-Alexandrium_andersonii.AAC.1